jgi:hypothetical protein
VKNFTWDECAAKAHEVVMQLLKDGYSGQDMLFIASKILHDGIYVSHRNAEQYIKENDLDGVIT